MKISDLEGAQLDYWVARAEGHEQYYRADSDNPERFNWLSHGAFGSAIQTPQYSRDWAYGGPIIEREHIKLEGCDNQWRSPSWMWVAWPDVDGLGPRSNGRSDASALVAGMRAYVASKFGDDFDE